MDRREFDQAPKPEGLKRRPLYLYDYFDYDSLSMMYFVLILVLSYLFYDSFPLLYYQFYTPKSNKVSDFRERK